MQVWIRLMGAKVGPNVEFSSTSGVALETLTIGDGAFVADSVLLGLPSIDRGVVRARPVVIENKAFIGNGAFVPEGARVGRGSLVALQTRSPHVVPEDSTLLGSPALLVQAREKALGTVAVTYNPSLTRKAARLAFEFFGYLLLQTYGALFATSSLYLADLGYATFGETHLGAFLATLPLIQLGMGGALVLAIVATKWIVMCGRFRAGVYPLFESYVWRTELIERLEENLAEPIMLNMLSGTRWKPVFYRMMGARIGKRPYLGKAVITEPDLVEIGDYATIEDGGTVQAHLFQDRMRVTKEIHVGHSVLVGANSIALLGGTLHNSMTLDPLSLSLRDEELPPRTRWHGSPASLVSL